MADNPVQFRVDTTEWNAALQQLANETKKDLRTIFKNECKTIVRKLIKFEYRADSTVIGKQLRERLVLQWKGGAVYNVPKTGLHAFTPIPRGTLRRYRAKRGGKLIEPSGIARYKKRAGYLASGWGRAGQVLGIRMPKFVTRHNLRKNGEAWADWTHWVGPRFRIVNKAGPGQGSRDKLNETLRIQAGAIIKSINAGTERAFARIRP